MERANIHIKTPGNDAFADQVLNSLPSERSYFEHYFRQYNDQFLTRNEERAVISDQLTTLPAIEKQLARIDEKIKVIINHLGPLLDITESFLRSIPKRRRLSNETFRLNELRDAIPGRSVEEIQKNCSHLIRELEGHADEFIDQGFLSIILNDYQLILNKLKNASTERAAISKMRERFS